MMKLSQFIPSQRDDVIALWDRCGLLRHWNNPSLDIDRKMTDQNGTFLVGHVDGRLVATAMIGYDGHRGSINYLAIDPDCAGQGYGTVMMQAAEAFLLSKGCPKINLCVRRDNEAAAGFYRELGYGAEDVLYFGKRLIVDK